MIPSELDRPALGRNPDELCRVHYLDSLVVSLNKATLADYARTVRYFERYRRRHAIVWSESPAIQRFFGGLPEAGLPGGYARQGPGLLAGQGYLSPRTGRLPGVHGAGIANFDREMLARRVLPALDPSLISTSSKRTTRGIRIVCTVA